MWCRGKKTMILLLIRRNGRNIDRIGRKIDARKADWSAFVCINLFVCTWYFQYIHTYFVHWHIIFSFFLYWVLVFLYIHTTHALSPKGWKRYLRYSSETSTFYQNISAMRNTADVIGGKPMIAVTLITVYLRCELNCRRRRQSFSRLL
jgi:hypothetical protein